MGLTESKPLYRLFPRIAVYHALPRELKMPNQVPRDARAEVYAIIAGKLARLADADALTACMNG
jgi:hypothetical protein